MKKLLLAAAALCLVATSAFASGADLTVAACPGGAGSSNDAGTLDCASGNGLTLYGVFQPVEAMTDLVAADAIIDLNVGGGVAGNGFWDLAVENNAALGITRTRPSTICNLYTAAWSPSGSGEGAAAAVQTANRVRIATTCYRPSNLNAIANQKIFGFVVTIDGTTATEAGGTANGCAQPVGIALQQITPQTASGTPTTILTTGATSATSNTVIVNGGLPVSNNRRSWGQLKSLYR